MKFQKNESGIYVPAEPEKTRQQIQDEARKQFYLDHACCPNCGGESMSSTCVGTICTDPAVYQNNNAVTCCNCKWKGHYPDLIPNALCECGTQQAFNDVTKQFCGCCDDCMPF